MLRPNSRHTTSVGAELARPVHMYRYRPEVLDQLALHGVTPRPSTPPALVRDYLSDLYRYEIRKLRRRLLAGDIAKANYSGEVVHLRRHYPLLSVPLQFWTM